MRVKLTLHRDGVMPTDIVVTADSTATVENVARQIAEADPDKTIWAGADDVLSVAVAPPTQQQLVPLSPDTLIGEAPIGSGFNARVVNLGQRTSSAVMDDGTEVVATLHVSSGPDAGAEFHLRPGQASIGRGPDNDIVLSDQLVSKKHARIEVGQHIEIVDLGSSNGIVVDGGRVQRLTVIPGQPFTLGDTIVVVQVVGSFGAQGEDAILERGGALMFNRSPIVEPRYPGEELKEPRMPTERMKNMFPWPMLVAPLLMAGALYAMTNRVRSLLIMAATPMMMFGNFITQRARAGLQFKKDDAIFEKQYEELEELFYKENPKERKVRSREVPAVATVFDQAMKLGPMLWSRRPEHWNFLALRLGVGRDESRNTIGESDNPESLPEYIERVEHLRERYKHIDDVPIFESLQTSGSFGVAGPKSITSDVLRGLVVQLLGMHAPNEVVTVALTDPDWTEELDWLKWMPHTTSERNPLKDLPLADSASSGGALLSSLEEIVIGRSKGGNGRMKPFKDDWNPMNFGSDIDRALSDVTFKGNTAIVLIVAGDPPVDRPRLTQILERGSEVGVFALFVAPTVETLPAACRSFIDVSKGLNDATVGVVRSGVVHEGARVEGVSNEYMTMLAKRLAPVVDSSTVIEDASDIPNSVMFLSLVGNEVAENPAAVIDRWRENNTIIDRTAKDPPRMKKAGDLRAIIGQGAAEPMTLDLRTQGPHALVGGTTGAGKSEFLQAWVLGMAAAHSPDRVTFLFVDYKGGSAFADCVELPHCVGLVTDLSPHLVRRALTSLRAELHFREHLFNRKKAKDLLELEKRRDPETPPALVLVVDEFAALAGEVPEFVDGVVDIAQRGRSLGIHLILATQRPAGVIKDNLRANTNLRVALRMADESDSKDVVDDEIAASFSPSIPGRGIAKTGPGRLVPFQSAYAGGWTTEEEVVADVRVAELRFGSTVQWEADKAPEADLTDEELGPNDQKRVVKTVITAADKAGIPLPRRPWLDDLSTSIKLEDLTETNDSQIVLGIADLPERQQQLPVYWNPDRDGSMLVYGTSGSGKTTVLKSIAVAAGMNPEQGKAEVYGLDFASGALRSAERLPQVGSVIDGEDAERVQRLLRSLGMEMDRRSKQFGSVDASNLTEYRQLADPTMPRIIVLIDNFAEFKNNWEITAARAPFYQNFMRILGEGRPLGVHAVMTVDRGGSISSSVASNVSRRIVLRLSEESGYTLLGVPRDVLNEQSAPGRAIVDGAEVQMAVLTGESNVAEQSKAMDKMAADLVSRGVEEIEEIGALPTKIPVTKLPAQDEGFPVWGIAEDTLAAKGFDAYGTFVVAGPPQSGRTNAMKSLIIAMEKFDPDVKLFHFGGRRSVLTDFRPWVRSVTRDDDAKELATELAEILVDESIPGRIAIFLEDAPQFADGSADRAMRAMLQAVNKSDHVLFGDGDISRMTTSAGIIGELKQGRQGIVLKPDTHDGDTFFKVPFPRVKRTEYPVGRGIFVQNGKWITMQMPFVPDDYPVPAASAASSAPMRPANDEPVVDPAEAAAQAAAKAAADKEREERRERMRRRREAREKSESEGE
ncbi:FtsK/SpoIIIE domain-containing protein [Agrococcus casei]|uniref:FtsK/SpoIIIE domain-containing protein n=1 Tax=Agrococcus casei TaxID=343512 RepID=UPI003F91C740